MKQTRAWRLLIDLRDLGGDKSQVTGAGGYSRISDALTELPWS
jgi:hypothetical protein